MSFHVWGSGGEIGRKGVLGESKIKGSEGIGCRGGTRRARWEEVAERSPGPGGGGRKLRPLGGPEGMGYRGPGVGHSGCVIRRAGPREGVASLFA